MFGSYVAPFVKKAVGGITILKASSNKISESYEFLAAFFAGFGSCLFFHYVMPFNFENVLIASLIVILPGLSVTIAMNELASQNLVSGTARLMGSMIGLLKIAFGIFLAVQLNKLLFIDIVNPVAPVMSPWLIIPAMTITSITFTIIFNAKKTDYIWVLVSGIVSFGTLKLSSLIFNDVLSVFLAAFTIGVFSNIVARIRNKPSLITLLPGIIFLVPGSVGIKGLNLIFEHNLIAGIDGSIKMFILSITIVTGLLIASIFVSPRKGL